MAPFDELQREHERLLEKAEAADIAEVIAYIDRARALSAQVGDPRERDQLRANLRYWASYAYDRNGTYPTTTLLPAAIAKSIAPPIPEPDDVKPPTPARPIWLWLLAAAVIVAVSVLALTTVLSQTAAPQITPVPLPIDRPTATALSFTPTPLPAATLVPAFTQAPLPAATATAVVPTLTPPPSSTAAASAGDEPTLAPLSPTPKPTSTLAGHKPVTPTGPIVPPNALPLQVDYRVLTYGPSPFNVEAWVIQLSLFANGGNGTYVYWVDGQRLTDPYGVYVVEGIACRSATVTLGVTSDGQAARREVTLKSPLAKCQ